MLLSRTILVRLQSAAIPAIAWLVVLSIGAWLGAGWFWRVSAPAVNGAIYAPIANAANAANEIASRHLFGAIQSEQQDASAPPEAAVTTDLRIMGVMTGSKHSPGFAVIQEEGKTSRSVIEGEEFLPGVRLEKVLPQGVELSRDGRREQLSLSNMQGSIVPPVPVLQPPPQQPVLAPPPTINSPQPTISGKGLISRDGEAKPAEHSSND